MRPDHGSSPEDLRIERQDGAAILTITRPRAANSLGLKLAARLSSALECLESEQDVRAIILTGSGATFCAGAEIGVLMNPDGIDPELQFTIIRDYNRLVQQIRASELPVIAAVNGACVGGGAALAMACDMAVASDDASYFFAFGRAGVAGCDMGCTYLLPRIVGTVTAQHWLLTGARVGAQEGLSRGLFVDVVPQERLLRRALELAASIGKAGPRRAAAATKQAIMRGQDADFQTCLAYEAYAQAYLMTRSEHKERVAVLMDALRRG
jgi:enoyl-CoA hydratase/carnithine racemase